MKFKEIEALWNIYRLINIVYREDELLSITILIVLQLLINNDKLSIVFLFYRVSDKKHIISFIILTSIKLTHRFIHP